ncbi:hypothetical protein L6248_02750 [Candidatus Parcubacteria bacterium]|nr:hypothetical protein [Candidatus Parcubacteria bacterium]MCG2701026.1 hypothetical protein [Candidatus Parcubacteria bacterium]
MPSPSVLEQAAREEKLQKNSFQFTNAAKFYEWFHGDCALLPKEERNQLLNKMFKLKTEVEVIPGEYIIPI